MSAFADPDLVDLVAVPRRTEPAGARGGAVRSAVAGEVAGEQPAAEAARRALEELGVRGEAGGHFRILPATASLVASVRADDVRHVEERLGQDYVVAPNIALDLPGALGFAPLDPGEPAEPVWDAESQIAQAHDDGNRGAGVVVGILDSGCDADHDEFAGRAIEFAYVPLRADGARARRGFDPDGHGTHVAGIVAGRSIGIAPEVTLLAASVIESERSTTSLRRLAVALEWFEKRLLEPDLRHLPAILNLSLGFRAERLAADPGGPRALEAVRKLLERLAVKYRVLVIVATGNEHPLAPRAPAFFDGVLSVGAVDGARRSWALSCGGAGPGLAAPLTPSLVGLGVDIASAYDRDATGRSRYARMSGTSMAAPYVTGIAALTAGPSGLHGIDLADALLASAIELGGCAPARVGAGLARVSEEAF